MDGHHTQYPGRGHAALGEAHLHFEEVLGLQFVAVPAGRLEDAEETGVVEVAQGLLQQMALAGGLRCAFAQHRYQFAGALQQALADQLLVKHW
ncbi:hypothetical protein D3C84_1014280 [compost metagenome]